jgi:hypothetical protein
MVDIVGSVPMKSANFLMADSGTKVNIIFVKKVYYNVPLYCQGKTKLCWAYCQVMIESYQKKITISQKEADERAKEIAIDVHGESWNKGGWPTNLGEAVIVTNILQLYLILSINGPVYAYYSNGKTHHHLVVVTGVDIDNNIVYTNNPWGIQGEQSFESFKKQVAKNWYSAGLGMVFVELFLVKRNKT